MNRLQTSLLLNAVFSGIAGLTLIFLQNKIASLFGTENYTVFWIIGALLIFFSLTIVLEIVKQRPLGVLWIIIQDILWVIGSAVLLLFNPFDLTIAGNIVIAGVAAIVLYMAINQSKALALVDLNKETGLKELRFSRTVAANRSDVWKVVSDVSNYDQAAPNIEHSEVISGSGEGMIRKCSHGSDSWTETCTNWIEEDQYSFNVNTSAPDYPYPLSILRGTWSLQSLIPNETRIQMEFEFKYKRDIYNVVLHPIMKYRFSKIAEELLDNWQKVIETGNSDE